MSRKIREMVEKYISMKNENTQRSYNTTLRQWCHFIGTDWDRELHAGSDLANAEPLQALSFINKLRHEKGLSDATVALRYHLMRKLYRFLTKTKCLDENPFDAIDGAIPLRQRKQVRPTAMIRFDLITQIINTPNLQTRKGVRDSALLAVLFGGGLRRDEARKLNVGDFMVSPTGRVFLNLRGAKGGDNQKQSIPEWTVERVATLISQRKSEGALKGDPLFVGYVANETTGRRIDEKTLYNTFKRYCKKSGVEDAAPHAARATCATFLKYLGFDDRDVQQFLRHKHPGMVAVYDKRTRDLDTNPGLFIDWQKKVA